MDIYPDDIGAVERDEIRHTRQLFPADWPEASARPKFNSSVLGGYVVLLFATGIARYLYHSEVWIAGGILGIVLVPTLFTRFPRRRGPIEAPVREHEVRNALQICKEPLRRSYLELVILAVGTEEIDDPEAERSVREAIQALGVSISQLPIAGPHEAVDNPQELQEESVRLRTEADAEADGVVAASLKRRSEALSRQTEVATRTATLLRRNEALRQEIAVQINALRTSLTAFRVGGRQSTAELSDVAASIQNVAREASAITQAREEMDRIMAGG